MLHRFWAVRRASVTEAVTPDADSAPSRAPTDASATSQSRLRSGVQGIPAYPCITLLARASLVLSLLNPLCSPVSPSTPSHLAIMTVYQATVSAPVNIACIKSVPTLSPPQPRILITLHSF